MENKEALLREPIENLPVSEHFRKICRDMGYNRLEEILTTPPEVLQRKTSFSYAWLEELISLLRTNGLPDKLQPLPGSNAK